MGQGVLVLLVLGVLAIGSTQAFGEPLEWKSQLNVGILPTEISEFGIELRIDTLSSNSLQLHWNKPQSGLVHEYQIWRKTLDSEYSLIVEKTSFTNFRDIDLEDGYYGYKIVPIFEKESGHITKHGIDRKNILFKTYLKGQELLGLHQLQEMCSSCFDNEFDEIENIWSYEYPDRPLRQFDPYVQEKISHEKQRAYEIFKNKFSFKTNH